MLITKNCLLRCSLVFVQSIFAVLILANPSISVAHGLENNTHSLKPKVLPLGDGKVSPVPKQGYVMACNTNFRGGGAHRVGEWIGNGVWQPNLKPTVEGKQTWINALISLNVEQGMRVIRANNLPTHASGIYPINPQTLAYQYDRNPNSIRDQSIMLSLPAEPKLADKPSCVPMGMIGFALSGAAIFNAFDAMGRDAAAYEIQDACNGHPERSGQYHYHDWSPCLLNDAAGKAYAANEPVGWMLDGFPILGPVDEQGKVMSNADLDECHGRVGAVKIDGQLKEMYHYRFTFEYPYSLGCYKGTPVQMSRQIPRSAPPPRSPQQPRSQ